MALDLSLQGIWISDRKLSSPSMHKFTYKVKHVTASISWDVVQEQIPAVDFVHKYENVFSFKFVHSFHSPPTLSILIHLFMAVNHSWPNSTKKQHRATTQATWTNMSHILQTDSFHFLESQRRRMPGVIYGTRFSVRHWLWTLRSTFIISSIRWVWIYGSSYLVYYRYYYWPISLHSTLFYGTFSASRKLSYLLHPLRLIHIGLS